MTSHTAPAAVSDLVMAERSSMHLSTGHAVHTAIAATTQHYDRSDQRSHHFIICLHTWYGMHDILYLVRLCGGAQGEEGLFRTQQKISDHYSKGVFGTVRTKAYRRYIPPILPVPGASVSSIRLQYR